MSFWKAKSLYTWDDETRTRALAIFDLVAAMPGTRVATHLRRPTAMKGRCVIVAADQDGLAFRTPNLEGQPSKGLAVRGMTTLGADRWQEWEQAARAAYVAAE